MAQGRSTKVIPMIKWIRTSRLPIKKYVSLAKVQDLTSSVLRAKASDSLRLKVVDFRAVPRKVDDVQASSGGCC